MVERTALGKRGIRFNVIDSFGAMGEEVVMSFRVSVEELEHQSAQATHDTAAAFARKMNEAHEQRLTAQRTK